MTTERGRPLLGVNLPWLFGSYGHDLARNARLEGWPCEFDTMKAYRPLVEARALGFEAVRIWLCENAEGIVLDERGRVVGIEPELLDHVKVLEECARLLGLRTYWTLLDANACEREGDAVTLAILRDADQTARFAEHVAAPIARALSPDLTLALEVLNEPETVTAPCLPAGSDRATSWATIGRAIRTIGDAVRAARPATLITSGTLHVFLPELWRAASGIDALDVHFYHPRGGLPPREDLAGYVGDPALLDPKLPLIGGECGIADRAPEGSQPLLANVVENAAHYHYDAVFIWRLERILVDSHQPDRPVTEAGEAVRAAIARFRGRQ